MFFVFGAAYIALGIAGFILTGSTHKTALIPAIFGFFFALVGSLAVKSRKRLCTVISITVAAVAFLATFRALGKLPSVLDGTAERPAAVISQSLNAALSSLYIILAVINLPPATKSNRSD